MIASIFVVVVRPEDSHLQPEITIEKYTLLFLSLIGWLTVHPFLGKYGWGNA